MGWLGGDTIPPSLFSSLKKAVRLDPKVEEALSDAQNFSTPQLVVLGFACSTSFLLGWKLSRTGASWKRLTSVSDIPSSRIGADSPLLRGRVVSVSDGDTFRFLHVPTSFHSSKIKEGEKMSEIALPIRICTIDTPETAKFGKEGQPFGNEAKDHLKSLMLDRMVQVRLLQKDQYGRGVGEVRRSGAFFGWPQKYMDQEMLSAGLAEVYVGGGAVYGHKGKDAYVAMQEKAKRNKAGMWSQENRESAAEYKARTKS